MASCTFEDALKENMPFALYDRKDNTVATGYFSNIRVDRTTLPEGWHAYDMREDDETGDIGDIESSYVYVNHCGTFLTKDDLKLPHQTEFPNGYIRYWANLGDGPYDDLDYSFL